MPFPAPEITAIELLKRTNQTGPPVNLGSLVALWPGLNVSIEPLDQSGTNNKQAGYLIDLGIHGAEMIVRAQDPPTRRRFTIAHELGHWVLRTSDDPMVKTGIGKTRDAVVEKWCNDFAEALLMPRLWVEPWAVHNLKHGKLKDFLIALLAEPNSYHVSHEAFRIRLAKLTPVSIFEFGWKNSLTLLGDYSSQKVPVGHLSRTLLKVQARLSKQCKPGQFQDSETGLIFAIHLLESQRSRIDRWLVCIVPETRLQKQIRLRAERTHQIRKPINPDKRRLQN